MDSVNKYGSDGVPFIGKVAEITPSEQQIQQMIDAFIPIIHRISDALIPMIESCVDTINQLWNTVLKLYPNKRIVWLASNHKKARVRKKNQKRIIKSLAKAAAHYGHS